MNGVLSKRVRAFSLRVHFALVVGVTAFVGTGLLNDAWAQTKTTPAAQLPAGATGATGVQVLAQGSTADGLLLQLEEYGEDGLPTAPRAIEVTVVEYAQATQRGAKPTEISAKKRKTNELGRLRLPALGANRLRAIRFVEAGLETTVHVSAKGAERIGIYHRKLADADVLMDVRANLSVRDGGTSTWLEISLSTDQPGSRRWTKKDALELPLLAPVIAGVVLDRGAITPATKNIDVQARDAVTVQRTKRGLALNGVVAPGRPVTLRIHYGMAIETPAIDLGLRGVVGKTTFSVATIATPPVWIQLSADRPARVAEHREGRERYSGASIVHPLKKDEVATIRLRGFPAPSPWPGRVLGGLAAAMFLGFSALMLRKGSDNG